MEDRNVQESQRLTVGVLESAEGSNRVSGEGTEREWGNEGTLGGRALGTWAVKGRAADSRAPGLHSGAAVNCDRHQRTQVWLCGLLIHPPYLGEVGGWQGGQWVDERGREKKGQKASNALHGKSKRTHAPRAFF